MNRGVLLLFIRIIMPLWINMWGRSQPIYTDSVNTNGKSCFYESTCDIVRTTTASVLKKPVTIHAFYHYDSTCIDHGQQKPVSVFLNQPLVNRIPYRRHGKSQPAWNLVWRQKEEECKELPEHMAFRYNTQPAKSTRKSSRLQMPQLFCMDFHCDLTTGLDCVLSASWRIYWWSVGGGGKLSFSFISY